MKRPYSIDAARKVRVAFQVLEEDIQGLIAAFEHTHPGIEVYHDVCYGSVESGDSEETGLLHWTGQDVGVDVVQPHLDKSTISRKYPRRMSGKGLYLLQ